MRLNLKKWIWILSGILCFLLLGWLLFVGIAFIEQDQKAAQKYEEMKLYGQPDWFRTVSLEDFNRFIESKGVNDRSNPLYWSIIHGRTDLVQSAIKHGADLDQRLGYSNCSLLYFSITKNENAEITSLLLEAHAKPDISCENSKSTPLMIVSAYPASVQKATLLIKAGANINEVDDRGRTPLSNAVRKGGLDTIKLLLENGANPNAGTQSPLHEAVEMAYSDDNKEEAFEIFSVFCSKKYKNLLHRKVLDGVPNAIEHYKLDRRWSEVLKNCS